MWQMLATPWDCRVRRYPKIILAALLGIFFSSSLTAQQAVSYHPLGEWHKINSLFGPRKAPFRKNKHQFHKGIDISVKSGRPVYAWRSGVVIYRKYRRRSGRVLYLEHPGGYISEYHHLSKFLVKKGASIRAGQKIAKAGRSGRVTGPHLHFAIRKGKRYLNPYSYLKTARNIPGKNALPPQQPLAAYKTFSIRSSPVSGNIYIDGKYYGKSPLTVKLPYGEYLLEIDSGENYEKLRKKIYIDRNWNYLYTPYLKSRPGETALVENALASSAEAASVSLYSGGIKRSTGLTFNANFLSPNNNISESHRLENLLSFETGLGSFFRFPIHHSILQYVNLKFSFAFGDFKTIASRDNNPQNLKNLLLLAGTAGYYIAPPVSRRLYLVAGGELSYGSLNIRAFSPDSPENADLDLKAPGRSTYLAPAASIGAIFRWNRYALIRAEYYRTFGASTINWSGYKLGLVMAFLTTF